MVLNLAGVGHIDSLGISSLVKVIVTCTRNNVGIATVLPSGTAGKVIRLTRIFAAWPEFATEEVALEQFARGPAS